MFKRNLVFSASKSSPVSRLFPGVSNKQIVQAVCKLGLLRKESPLIPANGILPGNDDTSKASELQVPPDEIFKGVVAYVEAKTGNYDVSNAIRSRITTAGGEVAITLNRKVNHVVFKDGRISTYKKAVQRGLPVVNTLWVVESLKCSRCLPIQEFTAIDPEVEKKEKARMKAEKESPLQFLLRMARSIERAQKKSQREQEQQTAGSNQSPFIPKTPAADKKTNSRKRLFSASDADTDQPKKRAKTKERRATCMSNLLSSERRDSFEDFKVARKHRTSSTAQKNTENAHVSVPIVANMHSNDVQSRLEKNIVSDTVHQVTTCCATPENTNLSIVTEEAADNKQPVEDVPTTDAGVRSTGSHSQLHSSDRNGVSEPAVTLTTPLMKPTGVSADTSCLDSSVCANAPTETPVTRKRRPRRTTGARFGTPINKRKTQTAIVKNVEHPAESSGDEPAGQEEVQGSNVTGQIPAVKEARRIRTPLPSLVVTCCEQNDRKTVESIAQHLGVFLVEPEVVSSTTHLVCGQRKRTMNMLMAMAQGCWVLPLEWVYESLDAGKWLKEDGFELQDFFPAIKVRRHARLEGKSACQNELLSEVGPFFLSPRSTVPADKLARIITLMGGKVVDSVLESRVVIQDSQPLSSRRTNSVKLVVSPKWILDCLSENKLLPMF